MSHEQGALVGTVHLALAVITHPDSTAADRYRARKVAQEALMRLCDTRN